MNSVPPAMRTRTSADGHGHARRRAGDAVDRADLVGDETADGVEGGPLDLGDEIVRAGDGVEVGQGGAAAGDPAQLLLHRLRLAGCRLDQHVRLHAAAGGGLRGHVSLLCSTQRRVVLRKLASVDRNHVRRSTTRAPSKSTRVPRSSLWLAGSKRAVSRVRASPSRSVRPSPALSSPSRATMTKRPAASVSPRYEKPVLSRINSTLWL